MSKRIAGIIAVFVTWILAGVTEKLFFLAFNMGQMGDCSLTDVAAILWHGLRLDMAIAGYLTIIPLLLIILSLWLKHKMVKVAWNVVTYFFSMEFVIASCANIVLYRYWGFPLDSTPIFYAISSPKDAAASASMWLILGAVLVVLLLTISVGRQFSKLFAWINHNSKTSAVRARLCETLLLLVIGASLFIPIRGGFSVAVNNVGSVYFSENVRLNHAAVNPLFSVMESLSHDNDFQSQYRYLDDKEAEQIFSSMIYTKLHTSSDEGYESHLDSSFVQAFHGDGDIRVVMVILESFSSYIMDGGEGGLTGITPQLQRLTKEGLFFSHFYSNSFRTDRALVSILSGYPAQPTTSLMKYPHKTNGLYSIAGSLSANGFNTTYVYGGDANFTNMRSYLMATGFGRIIAEEDYPSRDKTGKWGANDSVLFDKALAELSHSKKNKRTFCVVQTSSSHEPYDVPHHFIENRPLNAFHYADEQLGRFVSQLKAQKEWEHTLLVIVPDHAGCYPEPEPDGFAPYFNRIPMLMLGGAIKVACEITTIGCQQDIAATLLGMLGIEHSEFTFSKDIFDNEAPHFAFFTFPDAVGMVTSENHFMYDNRSNKLIYNIGPSADVPLRKAQAYLQRLYDDIARR